MKYIRKLRTKSMISKKKKEKLKGFSILNHYLTLIVTVSYCIIANLIFINTILEINCFAFST